MACSASNGTTTKPSRLNDDCTAIGVTPRSTSLVTTSAKFTELIAPEATMPSTYDGKGSFKSNASTQDASTMQLLSFGLTAPILDQLVRKGNTFRDELS